ncbi:MAG: hypothetical protein NUV86_05380, partial [Candidatus Scalindua sp.]|nr:hypothetical protein [Candidatus Scalindua sp.]
KFSATPCKQAGNIIKYFMSIRNRLKNRNHQVFSEQYAIINDVAHNYAMLTYYIDKVNQVKQLEDMGFETVEMYDTLGNMLNPESDDKDSAWIYYVVRKITNSIRQKRSQPLD